MKHKSKSLFLSIGSFLISSLMVFIIPVFPRNENVTAANILACVFWFFFVSGIVFAILLSKETTDKKIKGHSLRVFRFFRSTPTKITDTLLFIAAISFAVMGTLDVQSRILYEIVIFLFLFSAELHCVFNLID